jgi:hypothetical protein
LKLDEHTRDRLETTLLKMEHRTYLWLYLAIEGIYETYRRSLRPRDTLINSLPLTVKDAYEKILSRVPQESTDNVNYSWGTTPTLNLDPAIATEQPE